MVKNANEYVKEMLYQMKPEPHYGFLIKQSGNAGAD